MCLDVSPYVDVIQTIQPWFGQYWIFPPSQWQSVVTSSQQTESDPEATQNLLLLMLWVSSGSRPPLRLYTVCSASRPGPWHHSSRLWHALLWITGAPALFLVFSSSIWMLKLSFWREYNSVHVILQLKIVSGDFLGGPMAKTQLSQCRDLVLIPGQGTRFHMMQLRPGVAK